MSRAVTIIAGLIVCSLCYTCGLNVGLFWGGVKGYQRQTEYEQAVVAPVLAADAAFAGLVLEPRSGGGVVVSGTLSAADRERLRLAVTHAVGETRGREVIGAVDVGR